MMLLLLRKSGKSNVVRFVRIHVSENSRNLLKMFLYENILKKYMLLLLEGNMLIKEKVMDYGQNTSVLQQ